MGHESYSQQQSDEGIALTFQRMLLAVDRLALDGDIDDLLADTLLMLHARSADQKTDSDSPDGLPTHETDDDLLSVVIGSEEAVATFVGEGTFALPTDLFYQILELKQSLNQQTSTDPTP